MVAGVEGGSGVRGLRLDSGVGRFGLRKSRERGFGNREPGSADRFPIPGSRFPYLIFSLSSASHCDTSEMITRSPTARPCETSIVFTEARPSLTWMRRAW